MTNTVYFYNTIRDDDSVSTTTTEESPATSNRFTYTHQQQQQQDVAAWISPPPPGLNSEADNNDGKSLSDSKSFSFNELERATRNFHPDGLLGEGSFGRGVFKGWIDENKLIATDPGKGIAVAIEKLSLLEDDSEWWQEVSYLDRFHHPNLVRLIGYCLYNEEHLLVHEFVPRGSLDNHLFKEFSPPLSWSVRMKIALGAAKGLAFLHSASVNVILRDFKSSNILLDMEYNAKLSGFGLAMDGPTGDELGVFTRVMGTMGYAAPEYVATGYLTVKNDVWAFGVVLLEMLSGRQAFDRSRPSGKQNLFEWVKPYIKHRRKIHRIADSRLEGQYPLEGFQKAVLLVLKCLARNEKSRPDMNEVVKVLEKL